MARTVPRLRKFARALRRELTSQENVIWRFLRNRQFGGYKFRRQHPVGKYIVDFYCAELKLGLEVDGGHHETPSMQHSDSVRSEELSRHGVTIVRVTNEELRLQADIVVERIRWAIDQVVRARENGVSLPAELF